MKNTIRNISIILGLASLPLLGGLFGLALTVSLAGSIFLLATLGLVEVLRSSLEVTSYSRPVSTRALPVSARIERRAAQHQEKTHQVPSAVFA